MDCVLAQPWAARNYRARRTSWPRWALFTNIQYKFATVLGGVKVTYQVSDVPALPVTFDNFPWFSDEELSAGLKASGILFDGGAPSKGTVLDAISEALEKLLDSRNVHARVSHEVIAHPFNNQSVQEFRVENADLTIQKVDFSDPLAQSDPVVQERLPDLIGKPYSRSRVELFEFEQVRPIYLARAYLKVQFGAAGGAFRGESDEPAFRGADCCGTDQPGVHMAGPA